MFTKRNCFLSLFAIVLVLAVSPIIFGASNGIYPVKTDVTLTYWVELTSNAAPICTNLGDTPFAKELEKRTGIKVKYIHPPVGQAAEVFNLMMASGDLPDVIEYQWGNIPGGPNSAIVSGQIRKLNTIIDKDAPNLKKWLRANPKWDRQIKTDEGNYFAFPFVRFGDRLVVGNGPVIREDWLKDLKMSAPETIDEWYQMLKEFRDKKGATVPLSMTAEELGFTFSGAFNTCGDQGGFYVDNGKVKYGFIDPGRKDFLITMNKWFKEGLLDKNFGTIDTKTRDNNIVTGKAGAVYGLGGNGIGKWMPVGVGKIPTYSLNGTIFPGPKKGVKTKYARRTPGVSGTNTGNAAITTRCKNPEIAARFIDYNYSPEGHILMNFGIEGLSYKMVNGSPQYTDDIMHNAKLAPVNAMSLYMRGHYNGPFIQDEKYMDQYFNLPQQKEAQVKWMNNDYAKNMIPVLYPTEQESREMAKLTNDINTFVNEATMKFIMGIDSINDQTYNAYLAQLKKLGIDRVLQIEQSAYARYKKR